MALKLKTTKKDLYNKNFRYNKLLSDEETDWYSIRFPVMKYKTIPTVEGEISVELQSGDVVINVYNAGGNDIYIPYYNNEYGIYKTLDIINSEINRKLKALGIKETKVKK